MTRVLPLLTSLISLFALPVTPAFGLPASSTPTVAAATVVTLTFESTHRTQNDFAALLAEHGMVGTFYVNSAYLDYPAYLSVEDLRAIAREGNEVGGASLYGNDLSAMSERRARQEICDDRTTLTKLGFEVTSFSYPQGSPSPEVVAAVRSCGYNSGHRPGGLRVSPLECADCPAGETLPPSDGYRIRTSSGATTAEELERRVREVEVAGGGWIPLAFTKLCVCPEEEGSISPDEFTAFLTWLEAHPGSTVVRTVDQVVGGTWKPASGDALERLVPEDGAAADGTGALSGEPAWTILGVGIGQSQIIFTGVAVSIAIVLTFRAATRGRRHGA